MTSEDNYDNYSKRKFQNLVDFDPNLYTVRMKSASSGLKVSWKGGPPIHNEILFYFIPVKWEGSVIFFFQNTWYTFVEKFNDLR